MLVQILLYILGVLNLYQYSQEQRWEVNKGWVWKGIIRTNGSKSKETDRWYRNKIFGDILRPTFQGMMNHPVISSLLKVLYCLNHNSFCREDDRSWTVSDIMQSMLFWRFLYDEDDSIVLLISFPLKVKTIDALLSTFWKGAFLCRSCNLYLQTVFSWFSLSINLKL